MGNRWHLLLSLKVRQLSFKREVNTAELQWPLLEQSAVFVVLASRPSKTCCSHSFSVLLGMY